MNTMKRSNMKLQVYSVWWTYQNDLKGTLSLMCISVSERLSQQPTGSCMRQRVSALFFPSSKTSGFKIKFLWVSPSEGSGRFEMWCQAAVERDREQARSTETSEKCLILSLLLVTARKILFYPQVKSEVKIQEQYRTPLSERESVKWRLSVGLQIKAHYNPMISLIKGLLCLSFRVTASRKPNNTVRI